MLHTHWGTSGGRAGPVLVIAAVMALLLAALIAPHAEAAPGEDPRSTVNPDLVASCGLDIHVILDESGSIATAGATANVRQAFRGFTDALRNTGSRMAVSEFSTVARLPLTGAAQRTYTTVTDATIASTFEPYIANGFQPQGSTNWEDALRMGRHFLPRQSAAVPHLTVFITDGDPNRAIGAGVTSTQYETVVPLSDGQTASVSAAAATSAAVPNANAIRAQGSHVLAVAVGSALNNQTSLNRLIQMSGPNVYSGAGDFDISTHDVYRVPNFDSLEAALRDAAFDLCAPSVTVRKLIDQDADPGLGTTIPGAGWALTGTVSPEPAEWVLPAGATGTTATQATDAAGFATFQWNPTQAGDAQITVTEQDPGGMDPGYVNVPEQTQCTYRTQAQAADLPLPVAPVTNGFTTTVPQESIVTCTIVNEAVPEPAVTLQKFTNGADANVPPGPFIPVGEPITWTYLVTNSGNVTLSDVAVTDDQGVVVECPPDAIPAGEQITCTATGTATTGQYANIGNVMATDPYGTVVTAEDLSHYVGSLPGIDVQKSTNGDESDEPWGPFIPVGDAVTWDYTVTNTGTAPLADVILTDDQGVVPVFEGGDENNDGILDLDETWIYSATGTAVAGPYENLAHVTGTDVATAQVVADSDPSHYFGELLGIDIEKYANGEDADDAPGPVVGVGEEVAWTYQITNTGNLPLTWEVSDDRVDALVCPLIGALVPGESLSCYASGIAQPGQYLNLGTVIGTSPSGATGTDTDPAHYFGLAGAIELAKLTNGQDADVPPGPVIPVGGAVTWDYVVTNTGNASLTDVDVADDRGVGVSCPQDALAPGASMTCTATGTAVAGQYTNHGSVTAVTELGLTVGDSDPSNHFGDEPGIYLQKLTNGVDANEAPGPYIPVGEEVTWTYVVHNTGNSALTDIAVTDDQGVTVTCPQTGLAAGEEMTCSATGTSVEGQYENVGTATATSQQGELTDSDPSYYFGSVSALELVKFTNGEDANTVPGVLVPIGAPVTWTYQLGNVGNIAVLDPVLTDDQGLIPALVAGDDNDNGDLDPSETWTFEASGTAGAGQYTNVATATALDVLENPLTATDPSNYFGSAPTPPPEPGPDPGPPDAEPPPDTGPLPDTGWTAGGYALVAVVLLLVGTALTLVGRAARRRTH
ncbi:DUF7507 domain-containing protein [Occultella gossypii]|uniref:VWA domain-containing protein n=1 Tax=Occultella gossypii TaxID=2800820 RepID=A0ABS7SH29_9MICO|nr:VWA domain-containing protein [Occultella gossypii]MBZ2199649.1 VWA domain-containing protein [Occultella gossypii]